MDTLSTANASHNKYRSEKDHSDCSAECRIEPNFEAQHRALVAERVLGFQAAALRRQLTDFLEPLPQTRLHATQRAFREIGALGVSRSLRAAQYNLTRLVGPLSLSQVVTVLIVEFSTTTDDISDLVAKYAATPVRKVVPRMSAYQSWKINHRIC